MNYDLRIRRKNWRKTLIVKSGEEVNLETVSVFDKPEQKGEVEIKAVVMEGGKLNLKGIIKIQKNARGCEAMLKQRILVIGDLPAGGVAVVAEPQLEIECNEVKASHKASVGRLDEEQLFYLKSRGMSESEAKEMLIEAFTNE